MKFMGVRGKINKNSISLYSFVGTDNFNSHLMDVNWVINFVTQQGIHVEYKSKVKCEKSNLLNENKYWLFGKKIRQEN